MYKYQTRKKKRRLSRLAYSAPLVLLGLSASTLAFGFLNSTYASSMQDTNARVFSEGLSIKLDRTSPAFAALEDAWQQDSGEGEIQLLRRQSANVRTLTLSAGLSVTEPAIVLVDRLQKDNRREMALINQERMMREARSRALAEAAANAIRRMASQFHPNQIRPTASAEPTRAEHRLAPVEHPTQTISLTDLKVSRDELIGGLMLPIAAQVAPPTVVATHHEGSSSQRAAKSYNENNQPRGTETRADAWWSANDEAGDSSRYEDKLNEQSFQTTMVRAAPLHQVLVSGSVEFAGGLALSNPQDRLIVYRESDEEVLESGMVWLREGRYEIFLEETSGQLIAELRTPYGDILGRGEIDLAHVKMPKAAARVEHVAITLRPVAQGITGRVISASVDKDSKVLGKPLSGAEISFRDLPFATRTNPNGAFTQTGLLEGSTAIVRVSRPGYWGTTAFSRSGLDAELSLFPNQPGQLMHNLIALSRGGDQANLEGAAIIWGRVMRSGRPIAGAQVELMTTENPVRPIYFNSAMVPDPSLTETSSNGLYAFFPVDAGAHAVQATLGDHQSEPQIFPADVRMVSHVDIETNTERRSKVKVFDAFRTDWPLAAEISDPARTRTLQVDRSGEASLTYTRGDGLLILDVDGGHNYNRIRLSVSRDRRVIYAPMIQSSWIERAWSQLKLNHEPGTGAVVGFVQGNAPYKIALEESSLMSSSRLLYFNSRGEFSRQEYGEPGGGFVLLNVPEGFRTVTIQPSGMAKLYSSVILVESKVTSVINHAIR